jgi:hypothetical protein
MEDSFVGQHAATATVFAIAAAATAAAAAVIFAIAAAAPTFVIRVGDKGC